MAFAGVDLDKEISAIESAPEATTSAAPEGSKTDASTGTGAPEGSGNATSRSHEPTVLDSLERFRFQGKDYSREDLEKLFAQGVKEERQHSAEDFARNFDADKAAVLKDPKLLSEFAKIYPGEYVVKVLDALKAQPGQSTTQSTPPQNADPRVDEVWQVAQEWKAAQKEARIEKIDGDLNRAFEKLGKKYPDADPEVVNSRAWAMTQAGTQLYDAKGKLREDLLDKLFKADHEKRSTYYEQKYRKKVEEQKQAGFKARDVGTGGSAASAPAKQPRTIREATRQHIADLEAR